LIQENKEKITLMSAHKQMFKNYKNFKGRSRRKEYWLATAAFSIISFILLTIMYIPLIGYYSSGEISTLSLIIMCISGIAAVFYCVLAILPMIALSVRRLHDIGKSGWFLLLGCIPYIGSVVIFIFAILDSQPGINKYGKNPKEI